MMPVDSDLKIRVFLFNKKLSYLSVIINIYLYIYGNKFQLSSVLTFAVRETASLGIMGAPRVPPLNPSESIVL